MKTSRFRRKTISLVLGITLLTLSMAAVAFSQATTTTTNDFVPFVLAVFVPCANGGAGETVMVQGTLHLQQHITLNDNRTIVKTLAQPQGADGIGQTTGDIYNAVGVTQDIDTFPVTSGATEFTFVNNFRLIGTGPDNNFQVHQNVHVTVDANGNVRNDVDNLSIECN
ncbi:MAG TPA: hypothetical protein VLE19_09820 [Pyrinomonadaceae bacterium]|nr:hypothetical protein [Pyrinomonadaceae bacterium]